MAADPPPEAPAGARPRTQAERRAETRAALLDATIECLVTYGYAKTTTGRIAELAGVSRGAQIPYFRSRAELVAAAVKHLADLRIKAISERFSGRVVTLEEGLDAIWEEHQGPVFDAALELWVASRTEPELRETLPKIEHEVGVAIAAESQTALGSVGPGFTEDLVVALAAIRGLALLRISNGESSQIQNRRWRQTRERLVEMFD